MSDDDMTMGEVCDELQQLGSKAYVGSDGRVWRLEYIGECVRDSPPTPFFETEHLNTWTLPDLAPEEL